MFLLQAVRQAKGKLKDTHMHMSERFSRFSNVPATLLHVGFFSVDREDETMSGAAYHLLGAVCNYLKYDKSPIIATQGSLQFMIFLRTYHWLTRSWRYPDWSSGFRESAQRKAGRLCSSVNAGLYPWSVCVSQSHGQGSACQWAMFNVYPLHESLDQKSCPLR